MALIGGKHFQDFLFPPQKVSRNSHNVGTEIPLLVAWSKAVFLGKLLKLTGRKGKLPRDQGGRSCASVRAALTERSGSSTKGRTPNIYVEVSRNAYMKLDEIKNSNHPILDSSDVFCVQGD